MRCQYCGEKWSLECTLGPGGAMAPGGYFWFSIAIAVVGVLIGYFYEWLIAAFILVFAVLLFSNAISGSGYQPPSTAYQGSECPQCGEKHWIWPWSF